MAKRKRYDVYRPEVHGKELIGRADELNEAMAEGEEKGCRVLGCPCGKYTIYDNKLKTDNIRIMIKDQMRQEERMERERQNAQIKLE